MRWDWAAENRIRKEMEKRRRMNIEGIKGGQRNGKGRKRGQGNDRKGPDRIEKDIKANGVEGKRTMRKG